MIKLTNGEGGSFWLSVRHISAIQQSPVDCGFYGSGQTVITCDGVIYTVKESMDEVAEMIRSY